MCVSTHYENGTVGFIVGVAKRGPLISPFRIMSHMTCMYICVYYTLYTYIYIYIYIWDTNS